MQDNYLSFVNLMFFLISGYLIHRLNHLQLCMQQIYVMRKFMFDLANRQRDQKLMIVSFCIFFLDFFLSHLPRLLRDCRSVALGVSSEWHLMLRY